MHLRLSLLIVHLVTLGPAHAAVVRTHGVDPAATCAYQARISSPPPRGRVALTFDDGPIGQVTPGLLDVLARRRVRATFFLNAARAANEPALVARIRRDGHVIGSLGWDHFNFHHVSPDLQAKSVRRADKALGDGLGTPKLFRYPYGNSTCTTNALLKTLGYHVVGWHVDSCDWAFDHADKVDGGDAALCGVNGGDLANYVGHVVRSVRTRGGGIVLMHEIHRNTVYQVDAIIEALARRSYRFVTVADPAFGSELR